LLCTLGGGGRRGKEGGKKNRGRGEEIQKEKRGQYVVFRFRYSRRKKRGGKRKEEGGHTEASSLSAIEGGGGRGRKRIGENDHYPGRKGGGKDRGKDNLESNSLVDKITWEKGRKTGGKRREEAKLGRGREDQYQLSAFLRERKGGEGDGENGEAISLNSAAPKEGKGEREQTRVHLQKNKTSKCQLLFFLSREKRERRETDTIERKKKRWKSLSPQTKKGGGENPLFSHLLFSVTGKGEKEAQREMSCSNLIIKIPTEGGGKGGGGKKKSAIFCSSCEGREGDHSYT